MRTSSLRNKYFSFKSKMKATQLSYVCLVTLAFSLFVPFLAGNEEKKVPFHTLNVSIDKKGFAGVLIKKFNTDTALKALVNLTGNIEFPDIAVPFGNTPPDAAKLAEVILPSMNPVELVTSANNNDRKCVSDAYNKKVGYTGTAPIYFSFKDDSAHLPAIKKVLSEQLPNIYGLESYAIPAAEAAIDDALNTVFGKDSDLVFDKVTINSELSALANFEAHIKNTPVDAIKADEKDERLLALKKAIDAYIADKKTVKLAPIKESWLRQLKGEASLGGGYLIYIIIASVSGIVIVVIVVILLRRKRANKSGKDRI